MRTVGSLLKKERTRQRLLQEGVAKKLGLTAQFLGRIESGKVGLPLSRAKRVVRVLGISRTRLRNAYLADSKLVVKSVLPFKLK